MMDAKVVTGAFTDIDSRCYLAWANTLRRLLEVLGLQPAEAPQASLADVLAGIHARHQADEGEDEAA
jgi:hypothetical protein